MWFTLVKLFSIVTQNLLKSFSNKSFVNILLFTFKINSFQTFLELVFLNFIILYVDIADKVILSSGFRNMKYINTNKINNSPLLILNI
jgi:hypothetical protein